MDTGGEEFVMASKNFIPLENFNFGGLAQSKWSGLPNSLYRIIGWDMHSTPGVMRAEQKLTRETLGDLPGEFCRVAVQSTNGCRYWFSSESGKIWEQSYLTGEYRLVHITNPSGGENKILGAAEYQQYIYWATQARVHRIHRDDADNNNWASDVEHDIGSFAVNDSNFHPMLEQNKVLYIGDGHIVAQVDGNTFSSTALDLKPSTVIRTIGKIGTDILLGTYTDAVTAARIVRWNTYSEDFTNADEVPEISVNAFLPADNMVLVQAGNQGNIYYYDGTSLELYCKIPGDYSQTATAEVYHNSVACKGEQIIFGLSNVVGNPAPQGLYRMARHDRNFPYIMDLPYPISERDGDEFLLSNIEIGAVIVSQNTIRVMWRKNGTEVGIDVLDATEKLDGAYLESRIVTVNREEEANFTEAIMAYADMPANTSLDFYLSKNYAAYGTALLKVDDTQRKIISTKDAGVEFNTLQLKVKATTSANDSPLIESGAIKLR